MCMFHPRQLKCSKSPWGEDDQIGRLNWMTDQSRADVINSISTRTSYELKVDYFMGMPSWKVAGDPPYQIWMTHTPQGNVNDNLMAASKEAKELISYSGDAISMFTHTGTHIDSFNHFGYRGEIWNGYNVKEHLGSRHWNVCGVDKYPLIIARAVMLDVAAYHGVNCLPDSYAINGDELKKVMEKQGTHIQKGDIVMIRTGRMSFWPDSAKCEPNEPGINIDGAEFLVGEGAMIIGADNVGLEVVPSEEPDTYLPVHSYMFSEVGSTMIELLWLEDLSRDKLYECGFFCSVMPLVGATGAPIQPFVFPLK